MNVRLTVGLVLQFLLAASLMAQENRGGITGRVTDSSDAVIPNVTVTATNTATNSETTTTTNEVGLYRLLNLVVGEYRITYAVQGFQTLERSGVRLMTQQLAEINVQLQVGQPNQTIQVTAEAPILNTETHVVGSTLGVQTLSDLPLNITGGRNAEAFASATIPGVEGGTWSPTISGTGTYTRQILIDGAFAQASETGVLGENYPSPEALEELRVDTGGGGGSTGLYTGGSTYMFTMKSGTNRFHGSGFYYLHNEVLNANSWMNNYNGVKRDPDRGHSWGFSAGGPVYIPKIYNGTDKTFFFAAWETFSQEDYRRGGQYGAVPTEDFRNGDLSALLNKSVVLGTDAVGNPIYQGAVFDPGTGKVFPNNVIPSNRISSVAKNVNAMFAEYYPPEGDGIINNNSEPLQGSPLQKMDQFSVKIDHTLTSKDKLSGSLIYTKRPMFQVGSGDTSGYMQGPWSWTGADVRFGGPLSMARWHDIPYWRVHVSESHNFTPHVLNVLDLAYNRFWVGNESVHRGEGLQESIGFPDHPNNGALPRIDFGPKVNGYFEDPLGWPGNGPYWWNGYTITDKTHWITGRHTFSFGGEFRWFQIQNVAKSGGLEFYFTNAATGAPDMPYSDKVGFGYASFLLGEVNRASKQKDFSLYGRRKSGALFFEDKWKISDRFTLNYGLNWNFYLALHEKWGHWANFTYDKFNQSLGIRGVTEYLTSGDQSFEGDTDWKLFNPHIGGAYKVSNKVVIRAAYSMFYVPIGTDYWGGVPYTFAPGYFPDNEVKARADYLPAFNWDQGYPGQWGTTEKDPNYLTTGMVANVPGTLSAGRTQQYNAGFEYEIAVNTRVSVNYVATYGSRLHDGMLQSTQPDYNTYGALLRSGNYQMNVTDPASAAAAGVPYPYPGFAGKAWMAITPFPQIASINGSLTYVGSPLAKSEYNSIQAEVVQRFSKGLGANFSYVYQRQRSNTTGSNFQQGMNGRLIQNYADINDYDFNYIKPWSQQIFKGYLQYALPFGKGRQFLSSSGGVVDAIVGGWSLGTILYYSTGRPLSILSSNYYPGWSAPVYSNVAVGADTSRKFDGSSIDLKNPKNPLNTYFDTTPYSNPAFGTLGNSGPWISNLKGFGYFNQDLSIIKRFRVTETTNLSVRMEFSNVWNMHHWNNPDTGITSPYFGQVTSVSAECRRGQFAARFEW